MTDIKIIEDDIKRLKYLIILKKELEKYKCTGKPSKRKNYKSFPLDLMIKFYDELGSYPTRKKSNNFSFFKNDKEKFEFLESLNIF